MNKIQINKEEMVLDHLLALPFVSIEWDVEPPQVPIVQDDESSDLQKSDTHEVDRRRVIHVGERMGKT